MYTKENIYTFYNQPFLNITYMHTQIHTESLNILKVHRRNKETKKNNKWFIKVASLPFKLKMITHKLYSN